MHKVAGNRTEGFLLSSLFAVSQILFTEYNPMESLCTTSISSSAILGKYTMAIYMSREHLKVEGICTLYNLLGYVVNMMRLALGSSPGEMLLMQQNGPQRSLAATLSERRKEGRTRPSRPRPPPPIACLSSLLLGLLSVPKYAAISVQQREWKVANWNT